MKLHFRDWRGANFRRYRARLEITVILTSEQKPYLVRCFVSVHGAIRYSVNTAWLSLIGSETTTDFLWNKKQNPIVVKTNIKGY